MHKFMIEIHDRVTDVLLRTLMYEGHNSADARQKFEKEMPEYKDEFKYDVVVTYIYVKE